MGMNMPTLEQQIMRPPFPVVALEAWDAWVDESRLHPIRDVSGSWVTYVTTFWEGGFQWPSLPLPRVEDIGEHSPQLTFPLSDERWGVAELLADWMWRTYQVALVRWVDELDPPLAQAGAQARILSEVSSVFVSTNTTIQHHHHYLPISLLTGFTSFLAATHMVLYHVSQSHLVGGWAHSF